MYPAYYTYTPTRLRKAERNFLKQGKKHKNKKKIQKLQLFCLVEPESLIVDCTIKCVLVLSWKLAPTINHTQLHTSTLEFSTHPVQLHH